MGTEHFYKFMWLHLWESFADTLGLRNSIERFGANGYDFDRFEPFDLLALLEPHTLFTGHDYVARLEEPPS